MTTSRHRRLFLAQAHGDVHAVGEQASLQGRSNEQRSWDVQLLARHAVRLRPLFRAGELLGSTKSPAKPHG
jgi:hypothetical protein